jgi:Predicted sugar kinase
VGGPICTPEAKVLIIAPIAPHNLNVRPLIVPDSTKISISMRSREDSVKLSMDNRELSLSSASHLTVGVAQFSLKRVRIEKSSFFKALTTKLFWGEDIRNGENL